MFYQLKKYKYLVGGAFVALNIFLFSIYEQDKKSISRFPANSGHKSIQRDELKLKELISSYRIPTHLHFKFQQNMNCFNYLVVMENSEYFTDDAIDNFATLYRQEQSKYPAVNFEFLKTVILDKSFSEMHDLRGNAIILLSDVKMAGPEIDSLIEHEITQKTVDHSLKFGNFIYNNENLEPPIIAYETFLNRHQNTPELLIKKTAIFIAQQENSYIRKRIYEYFISKFPEDSKQLEAKLTNSSIF